jgi:antitoxin component YwqK of YwqJK toxin-antitoxin module
MDPKKWIIIGSAAIALVLVLIWFKIEKTPVPSLGDSDLIISDSGILCSVSDSTPYSGPLGEQHHNGQKSYALEIVDGVKQGLAIEWYDNGKKRTEVTLKDGQPIGVMNGWYKNGKQSYKMPLVNGEAEGVVAEYYPSGKRSNLTQYVRGKRHGGETGYSDDKNNTKLWEVTWKNDKLDGEYVKFYPTGEKRSVTIYLNGIRDGLDTGFFKDGEKSWSAKWKGDRPIGTHREWYETKGGKPKPKRQQEFSEGRLALLSEWYDNGLQSMEAEYAHGKLVRQTRWNNEGKEVFSWNINIPQQIPNSEENPETALGKPNPNAIGRRQTWNKNRLKAIYTGKESKTIVAVFGAPDQKLGDTWVYRNLVIFDPNTRRRLSVAQFLIKDGKVLSVEAN